MDNPFQQHGYVLMTKDIDKFFNELGTIFNKEFKYANKKLMKEEKEAFFVDNDIVSQIFALLKKYKIPSEFSHFLRGIFETHTYITWIFEEMSFEDSEKKDENIYLKKKYKTIGEIFKKMKNEEKND